MLAVLVPGHIRARGERTRTQMAADTHTVVGRWGGTTNNGRRKDHNGSRKDTAQNKEKRGARGVMTRGVGGQRREKAEAAALEREGTRTLIDRLDANQDGIVDAAGLAHPSLLTHTLAHPRTQARTHARTHARKHARTQQLTHALSHARSLGLTRFEQRWCRGWGGRGGS
eukprot:2134322-Rhodomonas_salina.2